MWEQQIILVRVDSEVEARALAKKIGQESEESYEAATGGNVRWTFREVDAVYELMDKEFKSGMEVFSRLLRASEARSLLTPFDDK